MRRVLIVAQTELLSLVRTKFFLISVFLIPVLVGGLMSFMQYASESIDRADRRFAVIDETGILYDRLVAMAEDHNREAGDGDARTGPHFFPSRVALSGRQLDDVNVALSEQVRRKELFAFIHIPATVIDPRSTEPIDYFSESTSYTRLSRWLETTLNEEIQKERFGRAGVSPKLVSDLTARLDVTTFGLVDRRADGSIAAVQEVDEIERFGVPFFFLILMFMAVMSNAQHLVNTIIEEKMSRISEVLLGSISAFQLLAGKLLGVVGVSLVLAFVYLAGGAYALVAAGRVDLIDPALIGWFLVFLVCASLMFGAVFQALSAASSDLKDAQSMLQPAMMLVLVAYLSSFLVIRAPDSTFAVVLSFIPTVTPFAMLLRLAMPPGPPLWQVILSVAVLIAVTTAVVWAAGRIFRVGLLMQGKAPNLPELLRWIRR
jgi:ABC-2 type transport system permease protein